MRALAGVVALGLVASSVLSCGAFLDIDGVEFGDPPPGSGGTGGSGSGAGGGESCSDGEKNGAETDVDCGGGSCPTCKGGDDCLKHTDCESGVCVKTCQDTSCEDGLQNGGELGIDCGGPTCPPCSEDCANGVDDNADGDIDCADAVCAAWSCVPPTPIGWMGPVTLYEGLNPPGCAGAWPQSSAVGSTGVLDAPPASCAPCMCSAPAGSTCELPTISFFGSGACNNPIDMLTPSGPGVCDQIANGDGIDSAKGGVIPVVGGSCNSSGGAATKPPITWTAQAEVCVGAMVGGGCNNAACAPPSPAGFGAQHCVVASGQQACPRGYPQQHILFGDVDDQRGCTACGCGQPEDQTCEGVTLLYSGPTCSLGNIQIQHDGLCKGTSGGKQSFEYIPMSGPDGGSCQEQGGVSTGVVTPIGPITVCCLP